MLDINVKDKYLKVKLYMESLLKFLGCGGGGVVVSKSASYSDEPSLISADCLTFSSTIFEMYRKNRQK